MCRRDRRTVPVEAGCCPWGPHYTSREVASVCRNLAANDSRVHAGICCEFGSVKMSCVSRIRNITLRGRIDVREDDGVLLVTRSAGSGRDQFGARPVAAHREGRRASLSPSTAAVLLVSPTGVPVTVNLGPPPVSLTDTVATAPW